MGSPANSDTNHVRNKSVQMARKMADVEQQERVKQQKDLQDKTAEISESHRRAGSMLAEQAADQEKARRLQEQREAEMSTQHCREHNRILAMQSIDKEKQRRVLERQMNEHNDNVNNAIRASASIISEASGEAFQSKWFLHNSGQAGPKDVVSVEEQQRQQRVADRELAKVETISAELQEQARRIQELKLEEQQASAQRERDWAYAKQQLARGQIEQVMSHLTGTDQERIERARNVSIAVLVEATSDKFLCDWFEHNVDTEAAASARDTLGDRQHDASHIARLVQEEMQLSDRKNATRKAKASALEEQNRRIEEMNEEERKVEEERLARVAEARRAEDEEKERRVKEVEFETASEQENIRRLREIVKREVAKEQRERTREYASGNEKAKVEARKQTSARIVAEGSSIESQSKWNLNDEHWQPRTIATTSNANDHQKEENSTARAIKMEEREYRRRVLEENVNAILDEKARRRAGNAADAAADQERQRRLEEIRTEKEQVEEARMKAVHNVREMVAHEQVLRTNRYIIGQEDGMISRAKVLAEQCSDSA